jgi:murein L,D-transpeptidase YafK
MNSFKILLWLAGMFVYACTASVAGPDQKDNTPDLSDVKVTNNLHYGINLDSMIRVRNISLTKIRIEVSKTNYTFQLWSDSILLKTYPCIFGLNPVDDKRMEGDRCTPEGTFKVIHKYPKHEWYKFIWFDYPNEESWRKFKESKAKGEIPKDAKIGGQVGIHGVGDGNNRYDHTVDERHNWTWGCIHLKNKDIDEVFNHVLIGTMITIAH